MFALFRKNADSWQQLTLSRTHMNAAEGFNLHFCSDGSGRMLVRGYLMSEGRRYSTEDGVALSDGCVAFLRNLSLDDLPKKKSNLFFAPDKTTTNLTLTDKKGRVRKKEIDGKTVEAICTAVLAELADYESGITVFENVILTVSGMRGTIEYRLMHSATNYVLSFYVDRYIDGSDTRELKRSVTCEFKEISDLLNRCDVLNWNGFKGQHPKGVLDGDMFEFGAAVNDGKIIKAQGSANYPKGYHELITAFTKILRR